MSGENKLKRFQFVPSSNQKADEFPAQLKELSEIIKFNSPGTFFVRAIVDNIQYCLYQACPVKNGGLVCKKKLSDELYCESCDHHAAKPLSNLYLRIDLRDCHDIETSKQITVFSATAVKFLNVKIDEFSRLAQHRPKKLASILQSKIEQTVAAKLVIKAKGESLDWVIASIHVPEQEEEAGGNLANKKVVESETAAEDDDDDIYTIDDAECSRMPPKRPKKNDE